MDKPKRRRFRSNYTLSEKQLLLSLIEEYSHILHNTDGSSRLPRDKHEAWLHIETRYNALATTGIRSHLQLRRLYDNLKKKASKTFTIEVDPPQDEPSQIATEDNSQEVEVIESDDEKENYELVSNDAQQNQLTDTDTNSNNQVQNCCCKEMSKHMIKLSSLKEEHFQLKLKNVELERTFLIFENKRREALFKMKLQLLKLKLNNQSLRINNKNLSSMSTEE